MVEYRMVEVGDAGVMAALNKQLIEDERHRNPMSVAELEVRMAGWLGGGGGGYAGVLFLEEGALCGYALYRWDGADVYLRQFFVCREKRRRGVGKAALEWLRKNVWREAGRVRVEVLVGNAAGIAFWKAAGFGEYCVMMERGV